MPAEARSAAALLWMVALGWGAPAPWLMWWLVVRGRLPVLPIIGEPNAGPFYRARTRNQFLGLLALSLALGPVQAWAAWLLWNGLLAGAILQFAILPIEATLWYGFELPIPPVIAAIRVVLVILAWSRLT